MLKWKLKNYTIIRIYKWLDGKNNQGNDKPSKFHFHIKITANNPNKKKLKIPKKRFFYGKENFIFGNNKDNKEYPNNDIKLSPDTPKGE